jgi:hypothetical protein
MNKSLFIIFYVCLAAAGLLLSYFFAVESIAYGKSDDNFAFFMFAAGSVGFSMATYLVIFSIKNIYSAWVS